MSTQTFREAAKKSRTAAPAAPAAPAEVPIAPKAAGPAGPTPEPETPPAWKWALALFPLAAFVPLLWAHAEHLWTVPHYQFFPFVVLGALVLAASRWRSAPRGPSNLQAAALLAVLAWAVLAVAEVGYWPSFAVVALQLLLAAALLALGGGVFFRALLPAWAFLWILMPLPFGLDQQLVDSMQRLASIGSSAVLDLLGVIHVLDGNVVRIPRQTLFVEEACAGLNSLFTLVACSLFLVLWLRRPLLRAIPLLIAAVGWVLACNILRIVIIAYTLDRFGPDWDLSREPRHAVLGFACFSLAVLLIWSTDRFFQFFVRSSSADASAPAAPTPSFEPEGSEAAALPRHVRFAEVCRLASLPLALAFAVLPLVHYAMHNIVMPPIVPSPEFAQRLEKIKGDSLPLRLDLRLDDRFFQDGYREEVRGTLNAFGEKSKEWRYTNGTQRIFLSLDYPFPQFHNLAVCYAGAGWTVDELKLRRSPVEANAPAVWHEIRLHKAGGQYGYVVFAELNAEGDALEPEGRFMGARRERAIKAAYDRIFNPYEYKAPRPLGPAFQFQAIFFADTAIDAENQQDVQQLLFRAIGELRPKMYGPK